MLNQGLGFWGQRQWPGQAQHLAQLRLSPPGLCPGRVCCGQVQMGPAAPTQLAQALAVTALLSHWKGEKALFIFKWLGQWTLGGTAMA